MRFLRAVFGINPIPEQLFNLPPAGPLLGGVSARHLNVGHKYILVYLSRKKIEQMEVHAADVFELAQLEFLEWKKQEKTHPTRSHYITMAA